jgi:hypothetical protein
MFIDWRRLLYIEPSNLVTQDGQTFSGDKHA